MYLKINEKTHFLHFFSVFGFGQNSSKDTLLVNGTQPASILKIKKHKIYIVQNKEIQSPFILQRKGCLVSKGIPIIEACIINSIGNPKNFVQNMFDATTQLNSGTYEIVKSDGRDVFISTKIYKRQNKS